jgi:type IV pilus assembly protein PilY1
LQKQSVSAGSFVVGTTYTIASVGTTNFTLIGAASNSVGVTFTATGVGTGSGLADGYKAVTSASSYTGYSINSPGPFPKGAARMDCSGTVGLAGCTQAEERQNFANWYSYYRTRNLLARGASMESFASIGNTIRVGFGRINKDSGSVDGVNTTVIESNTSTYGGGGVRAFTQTRKDQLFKWLEDLPASGGTPLPNALNAVGTYYMRQDTRGPYTDNPSVNTNDVSVNATCRRSYQLMVTDGYWNQSPAPNVGDVDSIAGATIPPGSYVFQANTRPYSDGIPNTLADVAMKYWKNDLQPAMANNVASTSMDPTYWQNMTNYMVGLGVRGTLDPAVDLPALTAGTKSWATPSPVNAVPANIDDLWHAALNTRGAYYSAKDPASLATAIQGALVGAQGGTGATAGVATVSSVLQSSNRKYVPTYNGNVWSGDISALPLDATGQAATAVWSAAARLPAWASRSIYTWDTSPIASPSTAGAVAFEWSSLSASNQAAMSAGSSNLVNFLRGDHSLEITDASPLQPYRQRKNQTGTAFVLGDFVNSNPVLIKGLFDGGYGNLNLGGATGYQVYAAAKATRDAVLFVGGNDGMLHGFVDANTTATASTDGREVFAYVPRAVYSNLSKLSSPSYGTASVPHQYFVDGPQSEADAYLAGPAYATFSTQPACNAGAVCWRNYLLGSLGAGGRAVYALDVTSSPALSASNIRWEISNANDADLGYILAPIETGVLPNGQWVAIFGNGFSSTNGYATLFVVDLQTAVITKLNVDTAGNNGLGGVGVQRNANGEITNLYAGDLKGQLWKFDYVTSSARFTTSGASSQFVIANGGLPLFRATGPAAVVEAITQPPSIFPSTQTTGGNIIVFGTGRLFNTTDGTNTDVQTIYGVWDNGAGGTATRTSLQPRALTSQSGTGAAASTTFYSLSGSTVDWTTQRGWYFDLASISGGRVIYPTQNFGSNLGLATVVAPAQSAAVCASNNGIGLDLVFDVQNGVTAGYPVFDTTGDGVVNSSDASVAGIQTNSVGRRAILSGFGVGGGGYSGGSYTCIANGGTCTGLTCTGGAGGTCEPPPICQPGYYPKSIQNAVGQTMTCVLGTATRQFDRIWRRIINPPIH